MKTIKLSSPAISYPLIEYLFQKLVQENYQEKNWFSVIYYKTTLSDSVTILKNLAIIGFRGKEISF